MSGLHLTIDLAAWGALIVCTYVNYRLGRKIKLLYQEVYLLKKKKDFTARAED